MEEAKKKIHLELEMTNDEAIEFFKNLTSLEERWKSKNNTKEGPLSLEDSLKSYIDGHDNSEMVEVIEFAEENYLFCRSFFASLEDVKRSFHLEQEEYEKFKSWLLKKIRCAFDEIKHLKKCEDSKNLNFCDLLSGFQIKKEELKFSKKPFEEGERDFKKNLSSERSKEQDERLKSLLNEKNWSIADVAREMSLSTRSIYRMMSKLGLKRKKEK